MVASIGCLGCQGLRSNRMVASIGCLGCQGLRSNRMVASIGCLGCPGLRSNRMVASIGCLGCPGQWVCSPSSLHPLFPSIHFLQKRTISIPVLVLYFQQNKKVVRGEDREDREDKTEFLSK
jgi:hypothetical protein